MNTPRLIRWLRSIRGGGRVPCVVCLKPYRFRRTSLGGGMLKKHFGMFCSRKCLAEYCRIVVRSAKGGPMESAARRLLESKREETYEPAF